MIRYSEIRDVHLEISTLCNASCPWCPRNFWGYPYNDGYPEINLTLENAKKIFNIEFLAQLDSVRINGNFGDIVMNPVGADIVEYFKSSNPELVINISTNGSARDRNFWQKLGSLGVNVLFALDGLEDTHHLYRQNTSWQQVLKNAKIFMDAGGTATWKMIKFKHNSHQIDSCQELSKKLGFSRFVLVSQGRDTAPVFDKNGNLSHTLGDYNGIREFKVLFQKRKTDEVLLEDVTPGCTPCKTVICETKKLKSIYISANGDVSPCCWTGFYPRNYGHGNYHQAVNAQLIPMIECNNALEYPLEKCIKWFELVEKSWQLSKYETGRLLICDDNCGVK